MTTPPVIVQPPSTAQAAVTGVKVCKRLVHNGTERVVCGNIYKGTNCPRVEHVLKIKTGFCSNGHCEGTTPHNFRGRAMPTCDFFRTCACECHVRFDEMFKLAEMERILLNKSAYVPERIDFNPDDYLPTRKEDAPSNPLAPVAPVAVEGALAPPPPVAQPPLTQRRTDTGRAAKGALEAQVWEQCVVFAAASIPATPKMLAELIADKYHIPTPSTGAIGAVFDRWVALGYAEKSARPVQFLKFTGEGTWEELDWMKAKARKAKRHNSNPNRRHFSK